MKKIGQNIFDIAKCAVETQAEAIGIKTKGICPVCESDYIKKDASFYDFERGDYVDVGIFTESKLADLVEGGYTCENGHHFEVKFDDDGNTIIY
jgi:hypothetical protein